MKDTSPEVFSNASELISALSNSQAEVEILKEQVAELRAERESTAATIAEVVKQQVAQVLAAQLRPVQEDHITGQQFQMYMQTQEQKFDALTAMFTQMMATQMSHHAGTQAHVSNMQDTYSPNEMQGATLGKRSAAQDLEEVDNVDRMETDEPANTRKRSDYRTTPRKASPTSKIPQANDIEPRRLMETSSPCQVPLPNTPPREHSPTTANPMDPPAQSTTAVQAKSSQAPTYQQQSMAKYLSSTVGMQNSSPPNEVNTTSGQSPEDNPDILSDAEDEHQSQSSGIESEIPTTPTSTNRRRGLNPGV